MVSLNLKARETNFKIWELRKKRLYCIVNVFFFYALLIQVSEEEHFPDKAGTWTILKELYLNEASEKSVSSAASEIPHMMNDNYSRKLDTPGIFFHSPWIAYTTSDSFS